MYTIPGLMPVKDWQKQIQREKEKEIEIMPRAKKETTVTYTEKVEVKVKEKQPENLLDQVVEVTQNKPKEVVRETTYNVETQKLVCCDWISKGKTKISTQGGKIVLDPLPREDYRYVISKEY